MPGPLTVPRWLVAVITAVASIATVVWLMSQAYGDTARDASEAKAAVTMQEKRIQALEIQAAIAQNDLRWIREALRTGRNPDTQQPLPR